MKHVDTISLVQQKGRRQPARALGIGAEDTKDPEKLAELLRSAYTRLGELEARLGPEPVEFEVNVTTGSTVRLAHNFNSPVRWYATHVDKQLGGISPIRTEPRSASFVQYGFGVGAWSNPGGSVTYGTRWRLKNRKEIIGVRFAWVTPGATTVRCRIWNDATSASLASVDVAVNNMGIYEGIFSSPITADLTGVDIVASAWHTAGTAYTFNADSRWNAVPVEVNADLRLAHDRLYNAAGDAKPATAQASGHHDVEPILGNNSCGPDLVRDSSSDANNLVLRTYVTGKLVIRVEPSQSGLIL